MADYRFNKPWAADSQNVQDFTEEEWGTGIVEKSLVSSSQVNGVMQAVTRRFLDLEAVEDRQYRYDFVVENQADWNKLINDNLGNAQSVLIRKGQVWTATNAVTLRRVSVVAQEEGAEIRFNGGLNRQPLSPAILSGGVIRGDLTNCRVLYATVTNTANTTYENTVFENSYVYTESNSVTLSGGLYCRSVLNLQGALSSAKLTDCKITNVSELSNCTLVRCEIPNNTVLTNCTVIDCDYTVDTYIINLVTGTTFRNCYVSVILTTSGMGNPVISNTTKFENCRLELSAKGPKFIFGSAYDCEFLGGDDTLDLLHSLYISGNSYMIVSSKSSSSLERIFRRMAYSQICTDAPFYREGSISNYLNYTSKTELFPGVICRIADNSTRTINPSQPTSNYFIQFSGDLSNTKVTYDSVEYIHTAKFQRTNGYVKITI